MAGDLAAGDFLIPEKAISDAARLVVIRDFTHSRRGAHLVGDRIREDKTGTPDYAKFRPLSTTSR
jgi:hypothetical protein